MRKISIQVAAFCLAVLAAGCSGQPSNTAECFTHDDCGACGECVDGTCKQITSCAPNDGCCPAGCDSTADSDCSATCGNGVVDDNETCDPPSSCPQDCDDGNACTVDTMTGSAANCNAACSHQQITQCTDGDGCCPAGCNANTDSDCSASCGNGVVEGNETCDPPSSCPQDCDDGNACTVDTMTGSASNCNAACSHQQITQCTDGDGCCPAGCNANTDSDCSASCGNGVVEGNETCDPPSSCPQDCDDGNACTVDTMTGSASNCNAACSHQQITQCTDGDGCCPAGCDATVDSDCPPMVQITSPTDGDYFNTGAVVEVSVYALAGAGKTISTVELYMDDVKVGEDTSAPYLFDLFLDGMQPNTTHTLIAKAEDSANMWGESKPVGINVVDYWSLVAGNANENQQLNDIALLGDLLVGVGEEPYDACNFLAKASGQAVAAERLYDTGNYRNLRSVAVLDDGTTTRAYAVGTLEYQGGIITPKTIVVGFDADGTMDVKYLVSGMPAGYAVTASADGKLVIGGSGLAENTYETCMSVAKAGVNEQPVWWRNYYGFVSNEKQVVLKNLSTTAAGDILIVGSAEMSTGSAGVILKVDGSSGDILWQKVVASPGAYIALNAVVETSSGALVAVGESDMKGFILKTGADGNVSWLKFLDTGSGLQELNDVIEVAGGVVVVGSCGLCDSSNGGYDGLLVKLDLNGDVDWVSLAGGSGEDKFTAAVSLQSGFAVAGWSKSFPTANSAGMWMVRFTPNGDVTTSVPEFGVANPTGIATSDASSLTVSPASASTDTLAAGQWTIESFPFTLQTDVYTVSRQAP